MPLSDDIRWTCARKKGYSDEKIARKVANRIKFETGERLNVYVCPAGCGRWHIGKHAAMSGA